MTNTTDLRRIIEDTIREIQNVPYVPVGISNRHIHISREDLDILFGKGYALTPIKDLLPGQFACQETVNIIGPKGSIQKVRILGPERKETQVEISLTDGFTLGVKTPVKESGDLRVAQPLTIENPLTGVRIERNCAIAALRHIHLTPEFAQQFGLKDKQMVSLAFDGTDRSIVFHQVLIRISKDFENEIHIDTDEANAGQIKNGDLGLILLS